MHESCTRAPETQLPLLCDSDLPSGNSLPVAPYEASEAVFSSFESALCVSAQVHSEENHKLKVRLEAWQRLFCQPACE